MPEEQLSAGAVQSVFVGDPPEMQSVPPELQAGV